MKCIIKRSPFPDQTMVAKVYDDIAAEMVKNWGWFYCPKRVFKEAMEGRRAGLVKQPQAER